MFHIHWKSVKKNTHFTCFSAVLLACVSLLLDGGVTHPSSEQKQLRCFWPDSSQTPSQTQHLASFQNQTALAFVAYAFQGETIIAATCIYGSIIAPEKRVFILAGKSFSL